MKITSKTLMVGFQTEVKLGNNDAIELTLIHQAYISRDKLGGLSVDMDLGIDTIDPGRYEVLARPAAIEQAYNLTDDTQQSGLGYLYDTPDFEIGYADAERRSANYTTNLIELDANLVKVS